MTAPDLSISMISQKTDQDCQYLTGNFSLSHLSNLDDVLQSSLKEISIFQKACKSPFWGVLV